MSTSVQVRNAYVPTAEYRQLIGGDWVAGSGTFGAVDPSVGTPWAVLPQGSTDDVERAVARRGPRSALGDA